MTIEKARSELSHVLLNMASLCTDAPCKLHENILNLKLPINTKNPIQCSTKAKEIARRVFLTLTIPFWACISLITGPIGIICRFSAHNIQKHPFYHRLGFFRDLDFNTRRDKNFSIFSLNTCCIGGGYPLTHGGVLPWKFRIENIVKKIKEENSDVICLLEVYDQRAANTFFNKLKNNFSHFYVDIGPHFSGIGAPSGTFVASKFRIKNPKFISFNPNDLANDKLVNRGCFRFTMADLKNKNIANIYATHLEYSKDDSLPTKEEKRARKSELLEITSDMLRSCQREVPTILTGDLNINDDEFKKSILKTHFVKARNSNSQSTCKKDILFKELFSQTKIEDGNFNLDHTLIFSSPDKRSRSKIELAYFDASSIDTKPFEALSDHSALLATIKV